MKRLAITGGFLALFSPAAWRATHLAIREMFIVARNMLLTVSAVAAVALYWWQKQGQTVRVIVIAALLITAGAWAYHLLRRRRIRPKRTLGEEPTQVLYRWWEPEDLPEGSVCFCGKLRRAGELVYVGITGAHRSRELDEDRRQSCWWRPGLVGTTETYMTRDEVEEAEVRAIRFERPRENKQHAAKI